MEKNILTFPVRSKKNKNNKKFKNYLLDHSLLTEGSRSVMEKELTKVVLPVTSLIHLFIQQILNLIMCQGYNFEQKLT